MEVSYDIVRVMKDDVDTRVGQHNSSQPSNCKEEDEPCCPQKRRSEDQLTAMESPKSTEDLDASRHSNDHGSSREVSSSVHIHTYSEHVMGSHDEAQDSDG